MSKRYPKLSWRVRFGLRTAAVLFIVVACALTFVILPLKHNVDDATAAAHFRSLGASVSLVPALPEPLHSVISSVFPDAAFHTEEIRIEWIQMADSDFLRLTDCRHLKVLRIASSSGLGQDGIRHWDPDETRSWIVSRQSWEAVLQLKELQSLALQAMRLDERWLCELDQLPQLRSLDLSETGVHDEVASALISDMKLTSLSLSCTEVTSLSLGRIATSDIVSLDVRCTSVDDVGCELISDSRTIRELSMAGTNITDKGARDLFLMPRLEELDLRNTKFSGADLCEIQQSPLRELRLELTQIGNSGVDCLPDMPNLEIISLRDSKVTRRVLKHLERFPVLKVALVDSYDAEQLKSMQSSRPGFRAGQLADVF
jgi:hypothetical protein